MTNWIHFGYCPACGKNTLYQHKHWTEGSVSEIEYCLCSSCDASFYAQRLYPEMDYYRGVMRDLGETLEGGE